MVDKENMIGGFYQSETLNYDAKAGFNCLLGLAEASTHVLVRLMYLSLSVTILLPEGSCSECRL